MQPTQLAARTICIDIERLRQDKTKKRESGARRQHCRKILLVFFFFLRPEQLYFRANFGYQPLKKGAATEKASPSALPMSPHLGPENALDALCDEASPGMAPRDWLLAPATLASSSSGLSGPLPHSVQDKQAGGGPSYGAERPGGQPARGNHLGRGSGTHSHLTGCVFQVRERTLHRGCLLALPQAASPSDRQTDKQATFQTPGRGNHRAEL